MAVVPVTMCLAGINIILARAATPVLVMEAIVFGHACIVARYWLNRADGNPAHYFTQRVSDAWEGEPEDADRAMLIPTIGTLLFTFAWMV